MITPWEASTFRLVGSGAEHSDGAVETTLQGKKRQSAVMHCFSACVVFVCADLSRLHLKSRDARLN